MQETTGARIKRLREAKGLTRYRLAKNSGVAESYIYRIEHDEIKNPRRDTLQKIATGFPVSVVEIIGEPTPVDTWQLVERSLRAYVPVYSGIYEEGMQPIDHVVCTRDKVAPVTVRGYRIDGLFLEPDILPGDTIIVDSNLSPNNGDLVVLVGPPAILGGREAMIRRYRDDGNGSRWLEDNEGVYDLDSGGCYQSMCIHGVITEYVRKLR